MPSDVVVAVTSMREYFRGVVYAALAHQALDANKATSAYLVELLCDYAYKQDCLLNKPLTWTVATAEQHPPSTSFHQLKDAGDSALYVAGYFHESLSRSQLDLDYYVQLGGTAYFKLSQLLQAPNTKTRLVIVFRELGAQFVRFVHVLQDVRKLAD